MTTNGERLPDVIFGGVYKAGTTFLRGYFTQHPQIAWTRKAWFFQEFTYDYPSPDYPPPLTEDVPCYVDMFEGLATGHVYEKRVDWPRYYLSPGVGLTEAGVRQDRDEITQRINQTIPAGKILLVLRNQIDWMRSAYLHHLDGLPRSRNSFENFLTTPQGKLVIGAAQFDLTISAFQGAFGPNRVHVMLLEELQADQARVLRDLCRFIDVDYVPYSPVETDRNTGRGVATGRAVQFATRWRLDKVAQNLPAPLRSYGHQAAGRLFRKDVISTEQKQHICSNCAASNARTVDLTGLDLARFGYAL